MRILQLCKKFPYPLKDGESLAVQALARGFHSLGCEVSLLAMNTRKHWYDVSNTPEALDHYKEIEATDLDNRIRPVHAGKNLFSNKSYHIERFVNEDFGKQLTALLQKNEYDVIQLETVYLAPYLDLIRKHSNALIVMRAHNVEHEIWERIARNSSLLKKWYLRLITPRLKKYETDVLNQYDLLVCISDRDLGQFERLGLKKPGVVAPIGLDTRNYKPDYTAFNGKPSMSFIGSLDWMPNLEGLQWFLESAWKPVLHAELPDLEFHIAGRNTPDWIMGLDEPGVIVHGEVPSAPAYINQHALMAVPLLSGGGMRAKILEAMALGRVVISSSVGLEGIHAVDGKSVLIANSTEEWLQALKMLTERPKQARAIGENARKFFEAHFGQAQIAAKLVSSYQQALKKSPSLV